MLFRKAWVKLVDEEIDEHSPKGEKVYNYSYIDDDNKVVDSSTNLYESIQSFKDSTDITRFINSGGFENDRGAYMDISKFGDDRATALKFLSDTVKGLESDIAKFRAESYKDNESSEKVASQGSKDSNGVTEPTTEGVNLDEKV
ncbi:MAG: internal scaffolding protein [Microvirus sp.]|nr:MAG: internal scaffolding protein [Microvirus sp.]